MFPKTQKPIPNPFTLKETLTTIFINQTQLEINNICDYVFCKTLTKMHQESK